MIEIYLSLILQLGQESYFTYVLMDKPEYADQVLKATEANYKLCQSKPNHCKDAYADQKKINKEVTEWVSNKTLNI